MKKRLSLLLAAVMIFTMLPISAFAAAHKVDVITITDTEAASAQDRLVTVEFEFTGGQTIKKGKVAFEIQNAELVQKSPATDGYEIPVLKKGGVPEADLEVQKNADGKLYSKDSFVVEVKNPITATAGNNTKIELQMRLNFKDSNDGDVKLKMSEVDVNDQTNFGSHDGIVVAKVNTQSSSLTVSAKDSEKEISYDGGELERFDIRNFAPANATHLAIELDRDDYYAFSLSGTEVFIDGLKYNLSSDIGDKLTKVMTDKNGYVMLIPLGNITTELNLHEKKLVSVKPIIEKMGRAATEGPVVVNVRAVKPDTTAGSLDLEKYLKGEYRTVQSDSAKIGNVVDFKVTMTVTEKGKKEIPSLWGGEYATVAVTLKGPKGSFSNRGVEFAVKDANVLADSIDKIRLEGASGGQSGEANGLKQDAIYKDGIFVITGTDENTTKLTFEMRIRTAHNKDGMATITAAQRGWEVSADLAKITPKFTVAVETTDMKKGEIKDTKDIVITEAKAGLLRNNESITLLFDTTRDYVEFLKVGKVEATNGMVLGSPSILKVKDALKKESDLKKFKEEYSRFNNKGVIEGAGNAAIAVQIPIKKTSKSEPAVITISGIQTRVDGSTIDQVVPVYVGLNGYTVSEKEYVKVVKEYGLEPILTVFTIGQTQYTVNGKPMTAASAPYVKNGRTMLPVRALAESLGLHVQWNGATKTATFTDSTKVAAVVIGADTMHINGTPVKLSAKAEIVNGTTFIELRSLATAFGVQIDWDAAAKTATVSK